MRLAVIGLGAIAQYFLPAIEQRPGVQLTAVCDADAGKLAPAAAGGLAVFGDYTELLEAGLADAVVITLPNHLHAEVIGAAVDRGVHVLCEKPLTITLAEAERLSQRASAAGTTLFTAFHRRYNRNLRRLKAELASPGDIAAVRIRYLERIEDHIAGDAWYLDLARCGGGCVIDNGPNALDMARYLLGEVQLADSTLGPVRSGLEYGAELELLAGGIPVHIELDWAYPRGEQKDVTVSLRDGRVLQADLLAGFNGFKSSLVHEYQAIVHDFTNLFDRTDSGATHGHPDPDGVASAALVEAAYLTGRRKEPRLGMQTKGPLRGRLIKLMYHSRNDRGMRAAAWASRCIRAGDIHELVTMVDEGNRVGFLGFAEFSRAGVLEIGDELHIAGRRIGVLAGFDESHFPNHYNILVHSDRQLTAGELDLQVGEEIEFTEAKR